MNFIFFFARRYIFARHTFNIINIVSIISIIGITVGVAALICVMSLFNGFSDVAKEQILGLDPHLRIIPTKMLSDNELNKLISSISKISGVISCTPVKFTRAVVFKGENMQVILLYAISGEKIVDISGVKNNIIFGESNFKSSDINEIIIGAGIGDRLRVFAGDTVYLMTPEMIETSLRTYTKTNPVKSIIRGVYLVNNQYDFYGFTEINRISKLFENQKSFEFAIDIRVADIDELDKIKQNVSNLLPANFHIESWKDLNKEIYSIMDFEKMVAFSILSLIILIAVFNIFALLNMTVAEKRGDISVLKAMGASDQTITKIFISVGLIIGLLGTVSGTILGLVLCYGQINFAWFKLDTTKYFVSQLPLRVDYYNVLLISIVSLLLSFIATIYPSRRAARSELLKTLREE